LVIGDSKSVIVHEDRMILAGLTGGIATGKSTVASMFAARGAAVVDADQIAHRLQEPGGACYRKIVEAFGREILDASGRIDRQRLGARAFDDPRLRQRLEAIMHPAIWAACEAEIRTAEAAGRSVCVVEAALILETGHQDRFQTLIVVTAPTEAQIARLRGQRGLTAEAAQQRLAAQWSGAAKARHADYVIDNGGDLSATESQVARVCADLAERQKVLDKAREPL
jgi:dephospho-CoA kinase